MNFQVPQRFELINGYSAMDAAVRLVPPGAGMALGVVTTAKLAYNLKVPIVYFLALSTVLQVVGFALLAVLPTDKHVPKTVNAYLFLAGLGGGIVLQGVLMSIPYITEKRDNG